MYAKINIASFLCFSVSARITQIFRYKNVRQVDLCAVCTAVSDIGSCLSAHTDWIRAEPQTRTHTYTIILI